ncbi:MAG: hypothetical protein ACXVZ1_10760 [Gaiellaceae bacterium]
MAAGGHLELATDHADYAAQMTDVLDARAGLRRAPFVEGGPRPEASPTFYERRALAEGRPVSHLRYTRSRRRSRSGPWRKCHSSSCVSPEHGWPRRSWACRC